MVRIERSAPFTLALICALSPACGGVSPETSTGGGGFRGSSASSVTSAGSSSGATSNSGATSSAGTSAGVTSSGVTSGHSTTSTSSSGATSTTGGTSSPGARWRVGLYTNDSQSAFEAQEAALDGGTLPLVLTYANYAESNIVALGQWGAARGTELVVAFEPAPKTSDYAAMTAAQQRAYQLDKVAAGNFDSDYVALADQLAQVLSLSPATRVWLRYASEMNLEADNTPWAVEDTAGTPLPGNGPANFIAAWQHVHAVVDQELTAKQIAPSRVLWVLAPGAHSWPAQAGNLISDYYPGDTFVDVLGMDGYNWGGTAWRTFAQVFDQGYQDLSALSATKPMMLAEFASDPSGGNRAAWIQNAAQALVSTYPRIGAFVWFDETHWALTQSDGSQQAFAQFFLGVGGCLVDSDCNGGVSGTERICLEAGTCASGRCHSNFDCPPATPTCAVASTYTCQ